MAKPLSNDIRERIVRAVEGGMSRNAAAQKYDVSRRLVPFVLGGLIIIGWLQLIGE